MLGLSLELQTSALETLLLCHSFGSVLAYDASQLAVIFSVVPGQLNFVLKLSLKVVLVPVGGSQKRI